MATTQEKIAALRVKALAFERKRNYSASKYYRRKIKRVLEENAAFMQTLKAGIDIGISFTVETYKLLNTPFSESVSALNSDGKAVAVQTRLDP